MGHDTRRFQKDPNFVTRKIAGETLLVPITSSTDELNSLFTLNEVASEAWNLIDPEKCFRDIQEAIQDLFDVDQKTAEKDLNQLFKSLEGVGAIQEVSQ